MTRHSGNLHVLGPLLLLVTLLPVILSWNPDSTTQNCLRVLKAVEAHLLTHQFPRQTANIFLDGDQVLDPDVCNNLLMLISQKYSSRRRKKRKAINFESFPDLKWNDGIIKYTFHEDLESEDEDGEMKAGIRAVIDHIESNTCLRFVEDIPPDGESYVTFTTGGSCLSYVGRSIITIPQVVVVNKPCIERFGDTVHLLGQTIGLFHEHQRRDRNDSITIVTENIKEGEDGSFSVIVDGFIDTFGLPYDFASIMHYSALANSKNDNYTITTNEAGFQHTIGQRTGLSFLDMEIINLMYCNASCPEPPPCHGVSYVDPNNCNRCKCPDGFMGDLCDQYSTEAGDAMCGQETITLGYRPTEITSPGYNDPSRHSYAPGQTCTWVAKTGHGEKIQLRFVGDFSLYRYDMSCYHWVEIRFKSDLQQTGYRYCGPTTPVDIITSETDTVMILFRSNYTYGVDTTTETLGFRLELSTVGADACDYITCFNGGTCVSERASCECPPGYRGASCSYYVCTDNGPCSTHGECVVDPTATRDYKCVCDDGFSGMNCDIDLCDPSPCRNSGVCQPLSSGFQCICMEGYTGRICETEGVPDPCESAPCLNGGVCVSTGGEYRCECRAQYTGRNCQEEEVSDVCDSNPCSNGGTCVLCGNNEYRCECSEPFRGTNCQYASCGGCGRHGPSLVHTCERPTDPPRQCAYIQTYYTSGWWRHRRRTRLAYKPCTTNFCCDNAHLITIEYQHHSHVTNHYCAVPGPWCRCNRSCGGCGTQRRYQYFVNTGHNGEEFWDLSVESRRCNIGRCRITWYNDSPCCSGYHLEGDICVPTE